MNKDKNTQCFWHANGKLECRNITISNKNNDNSYLEFNNFSTPNDNYHPDKYLENYNYYQQSNFKEKNKNKYIAPPKTYTRVKYLQGNI